MIVDAAREFHPIARSAIRPVEHALHGIDGQFVRGLAHLKDRMVLLLDVAAVLRPEETVVPTAVAPGSPA